MILFMKEKDTAFKDRFFVKDEQDNTVFTVEGKHLSLSKKLSILDTQDRELAVVQRKAFALTTKYAVLVEDEEVAEIHKEKPLLGKPFYKVDGPNWTVDGDIWDRDYKIRRNMNVIADISVPKLSTAGTYKLNILKDINPLMIVAVVTAIDCILDAEGEEAVNANNTEK